MGEVIPEKHIAVATPAPRAPLVLLEVPTVQPSEGEVLVHVQWSSSTPLHLHQADGGLLVKHPYILGGDFAGTVVAVGPPSQHSTKATQEIQVGDAVFGYAFETPRQKSFQTYITVPTHFLGRIPPNLTMQEAVTVPTNLVTAFHTITKDLGLPLPWPIPKSWTPPESVINAAIVVWGAGGSVGTYTVQVLHHWGYRNVVAIASSSHHANLRRLGAAECFDYRDGDVIEKIKRYVSGAQEPRVPFIVDCIASLDGTLRPLTQLAEKGTKVAVMLPVIMKHATRTEEPVYEMDVSKCLPREWKDDVELKGTRTHFYCENEFFKNHLQSEIIPTLLKQGVIQPNKQRVVEGASLLERAENALSLLRDRAPSGEKLVWRVAD